MAEFVSTSVPPAIIATTKPIIIKTKKLAITINPAKSNFAMGVIFWK
jgi:hypothetical protein